MNRFNVRCCGQDPRWVENVPGKGYLYCGECKNEVLEPTKVEAVEAPRSKYDPFTHKYVNDGSTPTSGCPHLNIHFYMHPLTGKIDPKCSDCGGAP